MTKQVSLGVRQSGIILPVASILALKQVTASMKATSKYKQILSSVREVGIIEPLIVFPQGKQSETYLLLDGHIRLEILRQLGITHVRCLISTDDETYTYNKRVSHMPPIQEHFMILKAIKGGASEERIAMVLNIDVGRIRQKRDLLDGICREAAEILKNRHMSPNAFSLLKKMNPMRQIEVAELLVASNNFSMPYIKALLVATHPEMLVDPEKHRVVEGLTPEQVAKMEQEMEGLQRDLKLVEESHGNEFLNLVLARAYLAKLFANVRVVRYISEHYPDVFSELQTISQKTALEN